MGLFSKKNLGFTESTFECKRGDLFVRGLEYRPEGENLPVAIVSHGFMASHKSVRKYAQLLASLGYVAYCYDFCGGSLFKNKSDGISTQMSVLTEVSDLEAVIDYAQSRSYTSNELLLMGCSQGGFVSAITSAKHPELVSKLVLFYPALCIPDDARAGNMIFAKFDPKNVPEVVNCGLMKLGRCYPEAVMDMDFIEAIKGYTGPVLIVHGTNDKIVNHSYSERAQAAYANAKLHLIDNAPHGFKRKNDVAAQSYLTEFAKR